MKKFLFISLLIPFLFSCNDDDVDTTSLQLQFTNLPNLGSDFVYEGWFATSSGVETAGRFSVDDNGVMTPSNFNFPSSLANSATGYILTIEPAGETGDALAMPSDVHILAGDFSGDSATLSVGDNRAIGDDFSSSMGTYILATPSTADMTDEDSGLWFLDPSGPAPSLTLPTLPSGWRYEGWGVQGGTPFSTGTFTSVSGADNSSMFSGPDPTPPFPGEDFVMNNPAFPISLKGGAAVISVEPFPDNSPEPFIIKPLIGQIPSDAAIKTSYDLSLNQNNMPSGTVIR